MINTTLLVSVLIAVGLQSAFARAEGLLNGQFLDQLADPLPADWTVDGVASIVLSDLSGNRACQIAENPAGGISRIYQEFTLPAGSTQLTFRYAILTYPTGRSASGGPAGPVAGPGGDAPGESAQPATAARPPVERLGPLSLTAPPGPVAWPREFASAVLTPAAPLRIITSSPHDDPSWRALYGLTEAPAVLAARRARASAGASPAPFVQYEGSVLRDEAGELPGPLRGGSGFPVDSFSAFFVSMDEGHEFERLGAPPGCDPKFSTAFFWVDAAEVDEPVFCSTDAIVTLSADSPFEMRQVTLTFSETPAVVRVEFGLADGDDGRATFVFIDDVFTRDDADPPTAVCNAP